MSRKVPRERIGPGDTLLVSVRDAAIATRYGLPKARRRVTVALDTAIAHASDLRFYRLDLDADALARLLGECERRAIPYEVWR
jgi:hypothetical protein